MNQKESIVAVMPELEPVDEQQLTQEVTDIEFRAESFVIQTPEDYEAAGEFGKLLKQKAAEVTGFADWWLKNTGEAIPELFDPTPDPSKPRQAVSKRIQETPPTTFHMEQLTLF